MLKNLLDNFRHIIHFNQIHIPVLPYISNFNIIYFMLICLLYMCLCVGIRSSATGVTNRFELPYGCLDMNLGPLE